MQNIDVSAIFSFLSVSAQKLRKFLEFDIFPTGRKVGARTITF